jgi:rhodanese-related sulfurtransferase
VTLEIRHTPGHTPESISIVVYEHADDEVPYGVMTGDTLFIGDVGRPDLLASIGFTSAELGGLLYDSLREQLMTLDPSTIVYPAHGAGSACGKNLSTELTSTIGEQLRVNYALQPMSRDDFIDVVTEGQPTAPAYFVYDAILNRKERATFDESSEIPALTMAELDEAVADGAIVVDTRSPDDFALAHLQGSVNVGLAGRYAEYAGSVVPADVDIVLVVEHGFEAEARMRLARIGFDRVRGYLAEPERAFLEHPDRVEAASRLTAAELSDRIGAVQLVDVREVGETSVGGTIAGAVTVPLGQLRARLDEIDLDRPTVVYCAGGYRSSIGASLLRHLGAGDVADLIGGYGAWSEHQTPQPV